MNRIESLLIGKNVRERAKLKGQEIAKVKPCQKTTTLGFQWNAGLGKWNLLAVSQEA